MYKRAMVFGLATVFAAAPGAGFAEKPAPFPDFKAKRIKPPAPGERSKRITIQIDPAAQPAPKPKKPADSETAAKDDGKAKAKAKVPGRYSWFWEEVSPDMAQSGPGRLDVALRAISGSGKVSAPRLQALQEIAIAQGGPILRSTVGTSVSPALVLAVIAVESAGKSDAVSGAGAAGLMQLMPDTATRFGVKDRLIADQNIKGGVKYLNWLMREFDNDPILVLAGYNAGEGAVKSHQGVPPYAETRDYVPKVLAAFKVASGLCKTPPQLITDGCVFAAMN